MFNNQIADLLAPKKLYQVGLVSLHNDFQPDLKKWDHQNKNKRSLGICQVKCIIVFLICIKN